MLVVSRDKTGKYVMKAFLLSYNNQEVYATKKPKVA